ncbi:hypothetical protein BGLY_3130 [Bacillus glycinifermentans]|nr:hypothetical protein BGLY_3130 [Bacillus glycinifermentans]
MKIQCLEKRGWICPGLFLIFQILSFFCNTSGKTHHYTLPKTFITGLEECFEES